MWVRAFDGNEWGDWDTFTLTTTTNTAPVATINDQSLHVNQWAKPQNWLSATDAEGDAITQYQFWDSGTAADSGYFWSPTNAHWAANTVIDVSAADLGQFLGARRCGGRFRNHVGARFRRHRMGQLGQFRLDVDEYGPDGDDQRSYVERRPVGPSSSTGPQSSDADGDAITKYQFWDGGAAANSAYFWTPSQFPLGGRHGY